ncbi:hypothetical protein EGR_05596 [Echinococcus granulosus]|uniref:Uncharacterized protein n=1 Tax=Echinococcus granulosus TaxID=6210 RepID=W6V165_ECHGR|nr:hypothetical protein EGR_05596 [Echinococcus granulosus]EUB59569.1 hypothetical protein EGR_05596 [Echinococcus granulosus]
MRDPHTLLTASANVLYSRHLGQSACTGCMRVCARAAWSLGGASGL